MNAEETNRWLYGICVDCKRNVLQCPMNPPGPPRSCAMFEKKKDEEDSPQLPPPPAEGDETWR